MHCIKGHLRTRKCPLSFLYNMYLIPEMINHRKKKIIKLMHCDQSLFSQCIWSPKWDMQCGMVRAKFRYIFLPKIRLFVFCLRSVLTLVQISLYLLRTLSRDPWFYLGRSLYSFQHKLTHCYHFRFCPVILLVPCNHKIYDFKCR